MSRTPRVLVVEDEQDIAALIKHALERAGDAQVEIASSGDTAVRVATESIPDLVILDLNLPVLSGMEVCRILRARSGTANIPIIMLTARTAESDRVTGLDLGADDYVTKPFSLRELAARVRAVLRRKQQALTTAVPVYQGAHLSADFEAVAIAVDGAAVRLTRREFELLRFLVENRNRVLSRDRLLERVWGYERFIETCSVDVHVGRLRAKLGPAGQQIETVVGLGSSSRSRRDRLFAHDNRRGVFDPAVGRASTDYRRLATDYWLTTTPLHKSGRHPMGGEGLRDAQSGTSARVSASPRIRPPAAGRCKQCLAGK